MPDVILVRPADSEGYTHLTLSDPVGATQAGADVVAQSPAGAVTVTLHGQKDLDVPADVTEVAFPDGTTWKP